jgi:16S rRNA C967 or C1407 C5-methylase (RsmB/RsmF family)
MRLEEIANDLDKRRIELLKSNAQRAKQQVKDAQARMKMKKAEEELRKSRMASASSLSLIG